MKHRGRFAVGRFGFVPLFTNSIPGFSVEEHVSPRAWFSGEEGGWEWKGPVIREAVYQRTPEESFQRMLAHLTSLLPWADEDALRKLLK